MLIEVNDKMKIKILVKKNYYGPWVMIVILSILVANIFFEENIVHNSK